jgi:hypothetical protein
MKLTIFFWMFLIFLLILIILDIAMIVSLIKTGDERRQLIVWKASTFTLLTVVLGLVLDIVESIVKGEAMTINPFIKLSVTATIYLIALLYYRRKYSF